MQIIYEVRGKGWEPITYMVNLAAELLEADLLVLERDPKAVTLSAKLEALLFGKLGVRQDDSCLLVCSDPSSLLSLLRVEGWRQRFRHIGAWIIDSFWTEWIPRIFQITNLLDYVFVSSAEDIPIWQQKIKAPVIWLPWATDVLRLGGANETRSWDLVRVGRQPSEWDDDVQIERSCFEKNLRFHGRPPHQQDPDRMRQAIQNQEMLMSLYRQTKFTLAFSNAVNPTTYTHPTRQYLTARWVDALACGATVAGISPNEPSINRLLWEGATLNFASLEREEGMEAIAQAAETWRPEQAQLNYRYALERLDWRWRFAKIAQVFNYYPQRLSDELDLLEQELLWQKQRTAQPERLSR